MAQSSTPMALPRTRDIPRFWLLALSYVLVALVAALPRLLDLGVFATVDEITFWMHRSNAFMDALRTGDFGATAIAPHPGVTTMWLGGIGQIVYDTLLQHGIVTDTSFQAYLAWQQLPVALANTIGVIVGYALLRRLFAPTLALLAALLWAADPFVIGFSRVLHVDMLSGTFMTLSLLAACVYWNHDQRTRWLMYSGVCGGLALLSKIPSVVLLPVIAMIALLAAWRPVAPTDGEVTTVAGSARANWRTAVRSSIRPLAIWGILFVVTILILWPATWAAPLSVYDQLRFGFVSEGGQAHEQGNFFLGQAMDAPGPFFYPVALALRATPWTLLGMLLLPFVYWLWPRMLRRDIAIIAGFVLVLTVALSISPKKFNRYLVPAFPSVDIIAAAGLLGLGQGAQLLVKNQRAQRAMSTGVFTTVTLAAAANAAFWHPYGMAAFNQALGGALAGANTFLIGWGEGLELTADWLNQQPDITGVTVATTLVDPLQRYLRPGAQSYTLGETRPFDPHTGYVVVYVRSVQDGAARPPFDQFYGKVPPLHVVMVHGVPYAWIYQMPPAVGMKREAQFGSALELRGFDGSVQAKPGSAIQLKLDWAVHSVPQQQLMIFAHVLDRDSKVRAQVDLPLSTADWRANGFAATNVQVPLPADLAGGTYQLVIGVYDAATGQRLPLTTASATDRAQDGPDALNLTEIHVANR